MTASPERAAAEQRLSKIVAHLGLAATPKKALASDGWAVEGRLFAFAGSGGAMIAKLPADRVAELIGDGSAEPVTMGTRTMREWLTVPAGAPDELWSAVVAEALEFVRSVAG